jgi:hypothetical protein
VNLLPHADIRGHVPARRPDGNHLLADGHDAGGSLKPGNAAAILALPNVDGGLIGGANAGRGA